VNQAALDAGVVARYRLRLAPHRMRGRIGDRRGSGVGSSMEFHDYRDYAPGDDLRHLDWRGYARTEKLRVRLHQEEVAPFVDVLLDGSASMAVTPGKEQAVRALVSAFGSWCLAAGCTPRTVAFGAGPIELVTFAFAGGAAGPALPMVPLRPRAVRVVVTDGLWQDGGAAFLRRVAAGAAELAVVQLLDPWEVDPEPCGALAVVDAETGERREVQFDAAAVRQYQERLARLGDDLRREVLGLGGRFARVVAADLATMCNRDLVPAEVVEPA
jgi:hypothetical protein